ncbi:protein DnaJ [Seminavis robusta]|uniref:Protein DnaJ n=1 Tax=Seminavis robusta TaxID=568900 RepID=A0A9N8E696_9STRA|nr:protein DnaJ [Seminavis robusta]|eukprot:Sro588_g171440.1 protein DnaJ (547) ;mRNA; f:6564-8647
MATEAQQKEREEAMGSLESILKSNKGTKPRNFREGLTHGVSNIVGGAVGAAGVAVLAPTVGLAQGAKNGGVLGGVVGLTGGAVVGVVGAVGLAVGGVATGVTQIVQGTAATPKAIKAQSKGQWWNEIEGRWVSTNLQEDANDIQSIPADDSDILRKIEDKLDSQTHLDVDKPVKDTRYYDVLEVDPNAESSAIKRKYYILARKYHPDKVGADDQEAANKFKDIAEAYQVLSDPSLRSVYDREGLEGLSPDKTSTAGSGQPKVDPALLFAFLFGSDKFQDYVGRLATATSASIGDSQDLSAGSARLLQIRRVKRLAVTLAVKLQNWVDAAGTKEAEAGCKERWAKEAQDLSSASYGIQLVHTIGQIYMLSAVQFLGSVDSGIGLPSISRWAKSHHARIQERQLHGKNAIQGITTGIDMMALQQQYEQKMKEVQTDEEREAATREMEKAASENLLKVLWTTTVVDLTSTLHEVAQMVFFDESVDKKARKLRAQGLKALGHTFMDCPPPAKDGSDREMDARDVYEEAAFNAMLETMRRKDEASFRASMR